MDTPAYYPRHLESPYSTWLVMSNNYDSKNYIDLQTYGMVIVRQVKDNLSINLRAKDPCYKYCGEHYYVLKEGESLVFLTDLWIFSYKPSKINNDSITFISETYFTP
jgi:hypothetical protein